ncbi:MAG: AbgT family transporter [Tenuifilaceae bacterium]|jgi:aminobenzoyl-glutamate transport protein|nr:AbgT family transporter [Tenuifilaceae bacterium]
MTEKKKKSLIDRFLNIVERGGNALPHPASLFGIFALLALAFSAIGHWLGWEVIHPATGEAIRTVNLLSKSGLERIIDEMVHNYTGFAPLGIVMVAIMGIGIAEGSGLIGAVIRKLVLASPKRILTFVIVFAGILSNTASDIGYVLLIPLAAIIFIAVGRHPIVGMAAAFAGVSGGFSANLILGTIDPLVAGLSEEGAHILDPTYHVNPTANYYFMVVSTFLIAFLGTWITEKFIAPRFGKYTGDEVGEKLEPLTPMERKGLRWSFYTMLIWVAIVLIGIIPANGILRGPDGGILSSPVIKGVIAFLFLVAGTMGIVYGAVTGKYKNDGDVVKGMTVSLKSIANYMVLVFFAAQFVAYFKWSNLGVIFAISGAEMLIKANLGVIPLMLMFIVLAAVINMFMGSASAKWAIMAPIFVPMFMLLGYSPELSQVVYRIGDSVTNVISPMMSFFALIIAYFQKYDEKAGIGTIISTMLPYSIFFFIGWAILLIAWILLGLPLGPGAEMYYELPAGVQGF